MMDLNGKAAIVTGSATGIGAATAHMLAARGCNVLVNYVRSETEAAATAEGCRGLGVEAQPCRADVSLDAECRRMVAEAVERWGRLDVLVNSAGTTKLCRHDDLEGLTADDFRRIYAVNTVGPYQMIRAAAPHMKAAGDAAVVNISSGAGIDGRGSSIAYATSKAALNTMTISLARVLAPEIRVNSVCPSIVQGRWIRDLVGDTEYEARVRETRERNPLGNMNTPDDVARVALWLIETATTMTGELINVDGGQHLL